MTVILVGGSVAQCAEGILNAGMKLQVGAFLLHSTRRCARVLGNEDIQVLGDDVQNVRD